MNKKEKAILDLFRQLPDNEQQNLNDFAEFLVSRLPEPEIVAHEPVDIPRPDEETVIAAVKRLSKTYPMVNKDNLLNQTSSLVAENLMHGKESKLVIDELETLFKEEFVKLSDSNPEQES